MALPPLVPVFITIDRVRFQLRLYRAKGGSVSVHEYPIATGVAGRETPPGEYRVVGHSRTPDWLAPPWAEAVDELGVPIAGRVFPFESPHNPFAGGFISLDDGDPDNDNSGIGIHGTKFDPRVGTQASHGCVRVRTEDFLRIYGRALVGSVVVIF